MPIQQQGYVRDKINVTLICSKKLKKVSCKGELTSAFSTIFKKNQPPKVDIKQCDPTQVNSGDLQNSNAAKKTPEAKIKHNLISGKTGPSNRFKKGHGGLGFENKEEPSQFKQDLAKLFQQHPEEFIKEEEQYTIEELENGQGIIKHHGKDIYCGEIRNGKPNGHGILYNGFNCYNLLNWREKFECIEGEFVNGLLNGECTMYFDNAGEKYEIIQVQNGIIV